MAWITIPQAPEWEYDDAPPDPGGALTALWSTGTNGIRTTPFGQEIYMNCRHKILHPDAPSVPNEINKTYLDNVPLEPDAGYVFVYTSSGEQVFLNDGRAVQVDESLANS